MTNTEVSNRLAKIYNRAFNARSRAPEDMHVREAFILLKSISDIMMGDLEDLIKDLREK